MNEMLGRWRRIYSTEWLEPPFQQLSDAERVVYFYARTGPQSTSVGIYRISTATAVEDIGNLTAVEFDARLDRVSEAFGWRFDPPSRVLWMPAWLVENPPQSPNVCVAWRKLIANLPDCDLKLEAAVTISDYLKDKPKAFLEAFGKDFPKDIRISKAKPKAKAEAYQGAGDQGSFRESGSKGAGALRAGAENQRGKTKSTEPSNGNGVNPTLAKAIKIAFEQSNPDGDFELLIDTVLYCGRPDVFSRSDVIQALNIARAERRPS